MVLWQTTWSIKGVLSSILERQKNDQYSNPDGSLHYLMVVDLQEGDLIWKEHMSRMHRSWQPIGSRGRRRRKRGWLTFLAWWHQVRRAAEGGVAVSGEWREMLCPSWSQSFRGERGSSCWRLESGCWGLCNHNRSRCIQAGTPADIHWFLDACYTPYHHAAPCPSSSTFQFSLDSQWSGGKKLNGFSHSSQDQGVFVVGFFFFSQVISQDWCYPRTPGKGLSDGVYLFNEKNLIIWFCFPLVLYFSFYPLLLCWALPGGKWVSSLAKTFLSV